jgi:subtilisin-like proprotein convertase family protein
MRAHVARVILAISLALPLAPAVSPVAAKARLRTVTRSFSNTAPITIPISQSELVAADPYPSTIQVSGLKGTIRDVNVRLNSLAHSHPDEVEVLLVGPEGQTATVMAHVGWGLDISDVTLRLDDEAATPLPDQGAAPPEEAAMLCSGAFRPTHVVMDEIGNPIVFNAPAPSATENTALSVFDGASPNGTWQLFVQDMFGSRNAGAFVSGWSLEITAKAKVKKKR